MPTEKKTRYTDAQKKRPKSTSKNPLKISAFAYLKGKSLLLKLMQNNKGKV